MKCPLFLLGECDYNSGQKDIEYGLKDIDYKREVVGHQQERGKKFLCLTCTISTPFKMFSFKKLSLIALLLSTAYAQKPKIRYMPFGDSITEIVCWRGLVWTKLQADGYTNVDFVGSGTGQNPSGCPTTTYDKDNEGHSGFLAIDIADKKQLVGWLQKNPADVITMHLGTNDIVQKSKKTADIIASFTTLVKVMRDSNPNMKIIVSAPIYHYVKRSAEYWS
jgi:hypothetical protein